MISKENILNQNQNEQPGIMVLVKCIEVIYKYLGEQPKRNLLEKLSLSCKKLYIKNSSNQIVNFEKFAKEKEVLVEKLKGESYNKFTINLLYEHVEIIKKLVFFLSSKYKSMKSKKLEQLLMNLLIPVDNRCELNEFNGTQVIEHYSKVFVSYMIDEEVLKCFKKFVEAGNNLHYLLTNEYFKSFADKNKEINFLEKFKEKNKKINVSHIEIIKILSPNFNFAITRRKKILQSFK
jgi:hypothetical protein